MTSEPEERDWIAFQMWEPYRKSLIREHRFFYEQAGKRLLSQFEDINAEAEAAAEEWLEQQGTSFDPDRHDPDAFYEAAHDYAVEFYLNLEGMRNDTRLSVVAGLFHKWDKALRGWLVREMRKWHCGDKVIAKVWAIDFPGMVELLENFGWKLRTEKFYPVIDACRLVVNIYKHGDGKSLIELRQSHPQYFDDPLADFPGNCGTGAHIDHSDLKLSEGQVGEFADAIEAFWAAVPANVFASQVQTLPKWFEKALNSDQNNVSGG